MREKVEAALSKIRPSLGGTDIALADISDGVVTVHILEPTCGSGLPKGMALELVEEQLMKEVPELKEVVAI